MNRRYLRYGIAFAVALVLQVTFVQYINILNWRPDLILIMLVIFALHNGQNAGSTAGFLLGVISDLISGGLLGLGALSKTVTGFVAGRIGDFFHERSEFIFTLFISGFLHDLIYFYINTLGVEISWWVIILKFIIPNLVYTSLVGIPIAFLLTNWLQEEDDSY